LPSKIHQFSDDFGKWLADEMMYLIYSRCRDNFEACGRPTVEKSGCRTTSEQQLWWLRHCDYAVQIREVATNIFFNLIVSVPEDIKRDYI
jgi:hypothetical protein